MESFEIPEKNFNPRGLRGPRLDPDPHGNHVDPISIHEVFADLDPAAAPLQSPD